jgi:Cu(I)/Ag(I) efflux system membrane fusion protein
MQRLYLVLVIAMAALLGAPAAYRFGQPERSIPASAASLDGAPSCAPGQAILYYREPGGGADFSAEPKKDAAGRDYIPVCDSDEVSFEPAPRQPPPPTAAGPRKILYYRNPMGLPDVSPVPKKDSMGMDYIPVYEGDEPDDGKTVKVSLEKVQRSGVRTEVVAARVLTNPVRGVGTVKYDERRLTVVSLRFEGFIEDLFVNTTGQEVKAGDPLFRVYSRDIQLAQADLNVATGAQTRGLGSSIEGTMQRLRNFGVPESRIQEVRAKGTNPRTIDWPSPSNGSVIDKRVINGQRVMPGDELYRIADLSQMWVIAEVAESDLAAIKIGTRAEVRLRAYPTEPLTGPVTFIYPDLRPETRTARVRIELPNPGGRLRAEMYADVVFRAGADHEPMVAVPDSAVIDSGTRQVVIVAKGEGRFEPRAVKLGMHGQGFVEVLDGVAEGESVVTSATFLIDSESNLNAALKSFAAPEAVQ